jgi:hypothetical protein
MRGTQSEYLGSLPFDVLMALSPVVLAGGLKFIYLSGPELKRGSTRIQHMHFFSEAHPEDY